ncbi:hypothetical protein CEE34_07050 [Candidatus Aerophobetes bacterium Ae_b3a]|nr:MAG: hypothetical protein CEE34_07050 [Candidatus Aerophobetes bacterium Ae_b3a]
MSLISIREILKDAQDRKYIVGYFEAWDYGSLNATVRAAEEMKSAIIIGFGGRSFETPVGWDEVKLASFASVGKIMAQNSSVPTAFILNEVEDLGIIKKGIKLGFNSVMFDGSSLSLEENIKLTRKVVKEAAKIGIDVEGQVGRIPSTGERIEKNFLTSPEEAAYFVEKTGVSALAISVGNIHMATDEESSIDLGLLEEINRLTSVPLVMHGGTGFPDTLVKEVINRGVCKFNVGTILKEVFLREVKKTLEKIDLSKADFQELLGSNNQADVFRKGYFAVKEVVKEKLKLYSSPMI